MQKMNGQVDGITVATYKKGKFTITCKTSNGFYCATFHNGRQTITTFFSRDKEEINDCIRQKMREGFKRV